METIATINPISGSEIINNVFMVLNVVLVVLVCFEYAVRKRTMPYKFERTAKGFFEPLAANFSSRVIMQGFVYSGYIFYKRHYGADVVRNDDDGCFFVDFFQQVVKSRFEAFVNVRIGFVEYQKLWVRYDCPA